eukprot:m.355338 g.355338  ORF g.355338 m.355338 type:complete len:187 (-) comp17225_c0_seq1:754-1314(-)
MQLVVLGSGAVGKSCLTLRFTTNRFEEEYDPTIENAFSTNATVDGKSHDVQILDTAGQEEFAGFRANALKHGDVFILIYSIVDEASFAEVESLLKRVQQHHLDNPKPIIIVGNKSDLAASRTVSEETAKAFATKHGFQYLETSARDDVNVKPLFESAIRLGLADKPKGGSASGGDDGAQGCPCALV